MTTTKQKIAKLKIYAVRMDGEVLGYVRHRAPGLAEKLLMDGRIETEECSTEDLMRIGRDGATVVGMEPEVDPAQQQLQIA